jgi:hypothetical protein
MGQGGQILERETGLMPWQTRRSVAANQHLFDCRDAQSVSFVGQERRSNDVPGVSAQPQQPDLSAGQGGFWTGPTADIASLIQNTEDAAN